MDSRHQLIIDMLTTEFAKNESKMNNLDNSITELSVQGSKMSSKYDSYTHEVRMLADEVRS